MDHKYKIQAGTIVRTVVLALALINQILSASGRPVIDISNETLEVFITNGITIIVTIWAWWKNNSFTQAALRGDQVMHEIKAFGKEVGK